MNQNLSSVLVHSDVQKFIIQHNSNSYYCIMTYTTVHIMHDYFPSRG